MTFEDKIKQYYPDKKEIDLWAEKFWNCRSNVYAEILDENGFAPQLGIRHVNDRFRYVRFQTDDNCSFYAYWQPAWNTPSPLLVHLPGYGAEISAHPELVIQGYNVLHISPLGYTTPYGTNEFLRDGADWPVLPDTIKSGGKQGYNEWLSQCMHAISWACDQPETESGRISFFGTSQGGGAALLLGSIYANRGVRCVAADMPFLTNFPLAGGRGAYQLAQTALNDLENPSPGWKALGYIDTLSHAHRLNVPVMLTSGTDDTVTPQDTILSLFNNLQGTRSYTSLNQMEHRYSYPFVPLASSWFSLYA